MSQENLKHRFQKLDERTVLYIVVFLALATGMPSAFSGIDGDWWKSLLQNLCTEMVGALVTYWLFTKILGGQEKSQAETKEKQQLIIELRSKDNAAALTVLEKIRQRKSDIDGTLMGADLRFANLQDAFFMDANLQRVVLAAANLQRTNLRKANLEGAILIKSNLKGANLQYTNLQKVDLQDVSLQDANLEGTIFDESTVLPDAQYIGNGRHTIYWTPETDMNRYTDPDHIDFWQPEWVKAQK